MPSMPQRYGFAVFPTSQNDTSSFNLAFTVFVKSQNQSFYA